VLRAFSELPESSLTPRRQPLNPNQIRTDVQLDLQVDGSNVSGFLGDDGIWEMPMKITLGTIEGKTVRFMTKRMSGGRVPYFYQWMVEWIDDNTISLRRGNIAAGGQGDNGRPLSGGSPPVQPPAALPALNRMSLSAPLLLHRVK
jgi:hypothetical protein